MVDILSVGGFFRVHFFFKKKKGILFVSNPETDVTLNHF